MSKESWKEKFIAARDGVSLEDCRGWKGNLLVIAPHPDDDVLGAGGMMLQAAGQGRGVFSVYMTDGRRSPRIDPSISDDEMAQKRQKEALAALKILGAAGGFFLQRESVDLEGAARKKVQGELSEIIEWIAPREFFLPAPYERHPTHQRCLRLAVEALRACPGVKPVLMGYSLWGSFWGEKNRVARDITPHIRKKVEAVLAHSSQVAYKNYQQGILGKNNYEAIFWESHELQKMTFVETFLDMTELLEKKDMALEEFIRQDVQKFIETYL